MAPTKVFVGNLSFKINDSELADHFQPFQVVSVHIITRGPRSLGYGFIELESEEQAQNAINVMNKKAIEGREINVELAKPRQTTPIPPRPTNRGRGRGASNSNRGSPVVPNAQNGTNTDAVGTPPPDAQTPKSPQRTNIRKRYRRPRRGPKQPPQQQEAAGDNSQQQQQQQQPPQPEAQDQPQRQFSESSRGRRRGQNGRDRGRGRGFFDRSSARTTTRIDSATSLFVANLPFDLSEETLLEHFKGFNATRAHIVTNYQGRSRGFGFVEFANETDQNAAFAATNQNNIVISDRTLTVKLVQLKEKQPESVPPETTQTVAGDEPQNN